MTIVFASHSPFDDCMVVGSHQLAPALAQAGHTVWHIGPPVTPIHLAYLSDRNYRNRLFKSLRPPYEVQKNLMSMEPFSTVPWQVARRTMRFGNLFVRSSNIRSTLAKAGGLSHIDVLLVDDPRFSGLEDLLQPQAVFYRATDLYAEMKQDVQLITAERQLLRNCSGVIATSQPILSHVLSLKPDIPSLLMENGVDYAHFSKPCAEPEELKSIPHPRMIYAGALDFRFDVDLLAEMARGFREGHFIIIGQGSKLKALQALGLSNIHVLGSKPYQSLPGFLQHADVGILPLVDNVANSARSPMKLYEYGTAGLPVVARRTSELSRRAEDFVYLFSSGEESVASLTKALDQPRNRRATQNSCAHHSWANKAVTLTNFISETLRKDLTADLPIEPSFSEHC